MIITHIYILNFERSLSLSPGPQSSLVPPCKISPGGPVRFIIRIEFFDLSDIFAAEVFCVFVCPVCVFVLFKLLFAHQVIFEGTHMWKALVWPHYVTKRRSLGPIKFDPATLYWQKCEWPCICASKVSILPLFLQFIRFDFGPVPTVWYYFVFHFICILPWT